MTTSKQSFLQKQTQHFKPLTTSQKTYGWCQDKMLLIVYGKLRAAEQQPLMPFPLDTAAWHHNGGQSSCVTTYPPLLEQYTSKTWSPSLSVLHSPALLLFCQGLLLADRHLLCPSQRLGVADTAPKFTLIEAVVHLVFCTSAASLIPFHSGAKCFP
jgi:hypothetical protein